MNSPLGMKKRLRAAASLPSSLRISRSSGTVSISGLSKSSSGTAKLPCASASAPPSVLELVLVTYAYRSSSPGLGTHA